MHMEKCDIQPGKMDDLDRKLNPHHKGQVIDVQVMRHPLTTNPAGLGIAESGLLVEVDDAARFIGQKIRVRLLRIGRSLAQAESLIKPKEQPKPSVKPHAAKPAPARAEATRPAPEGAANRNDSTKSRRRRRSGGGGSAKPKV
jgi:hypothetical protein